MKIVRRFRPRHALVLLATCALAGCIEFEHQTLTFRHDAARDTLLIYQNYRGIRGEDHARHGGPMALSPNEQHQLLSVWHDEHTFFFGNWITELNLSEMRRKLAEETAPDAGEPATAEPVAMRQLATQLLTSVRIHSGPFYRDDRGHLGGVQRVTVSNVSAIVAAGNTAIRAACAEEAGKEANDEVTRARFRRAAQDPEPFIVVDGNRITVRLPMSQQEYAKSADPESAGADPVVVAFARAGGKVTFAVGIATIVFGRTDSTRETLALPVEPDTYDASAEAFVRDRFGIAEAFDPAVDAERFFAPPAPPP
jgi:hypothetical protein